MSTVNNEKVMNSKAVVMGCACVVFSSLTPDEIRRFKRLHPESLSLMEGESGDEPTFRIDVADGPGSITLEGALFSNVTTADGKATITVLLDPEIDDPMNVVKEKIGGPLMRLIELEKHLMEQLPKLEEEEKAISEHITQL